MGHPQIRQKGQSETCADLKKYEELFDVQEGNEQVNSPTDEGHILNTSDDEYMRKEYLILLLLLNFSWASLS